MRFIIGGLLALLVSLAVQPVAAQSNTWTAEYFNNPSLAGAPIVVRTESSPTNEWGYGSPAAGIPAENFSARWTTTTWVNEGVYQISIRADDGVRLFVDGVAYINEWHPAAGRLYQATVTLAEGNHTFVVEYYEAYEVAFLIYNFSPLGGPPPGPGQPQATVTAQFLNLRAQANPYAPILQVLSRGQTYPVIGRNVDTSWLQLNVNGTIGWVNASYVNAVNISGVPITDGGGIPPTPVPPPVSATATVTAYLLNVRNAPNPFTGAVVTQIRRNEVYPIVGRNLDTSWVQINANGLIGWVRSSWTILNNAQSVPVTSNTTNPSPAPGPVYSQATVRAYFLNVRSLPYYGAPVLTLISRGQTYPAIGRNASSTWVQINVGGTVGWVRSTWVIVSPNLLSVPVTG
jgi:uncharacterized protein YraI